MVGEKRVSEGEVTYENLSEAFGLERRLTRIGVKGPKYRKVSG